jgi:microcystin degradation protein MlrC
MKLRSDVLVRTKLNQVEQKSDTWDALMDIVAAYEKYPHSDVHVEKEVQELLTGTRDCDCTSCAAQGIVYEWFLGI